MIYIGKRAYSRWPSALILQLISAEKATAVGLGQPQGPSYRQDNRLIRTLGRARRHHRLCQERAQWGRSNPDGSRKKSLYREGASLIRHPSKSKGPAPRSRLAPCRVSCSFVVFARSRHIVRATKQSSLIQRKHSSCRKGLSFIQHPAQSDQLTFFARNQSAAKAWGKRGLFRLEESETAYPIIRGDRAPWGSQLTYIVKRKHPDFFMYRID